MIKILQTRMILILAVVLVSFNTCFSQGICEWTNFKLDRIKGRVVSDGPHGDEPIADAKVQLWRIHDSGDVLAASASTDENGVFELRRMKSGQYRLEVSKSTSPFVRNYVGVRVVKRVNEPNGGSWLVFHLGIASLEPCGGGRVALVANQ